MATTKVTAGSLSQTKTQTEIDEPDSVLLTIARNHACAKHPFFEIVQTAMLTPLNAGMLLRNYDAHASVLRRLLLKAAVIMPDKAVGFVLENVRTEFGSGNIDNRHQLQLVDVALRTGITATQFRSFAIQPGIKRFIKAVTPFYFPITKADKQLFGKANRSAIAAGAITATEILAIEEFKVLQIAFSQFDLQDHIWFDHVSVEAEHTEESLALAHYFMQKGRHDLTDDVLLGLNGVLDANLALYDGLLEAMQYSR